MTLFRRVFLTNAALLVAAATVLAVTPLTISAPIAEIEAVVLGVGLSLLLVLNYLILRRAFRPLERLSERMRRVDLLRPGRRMPPSGHDQVAELVHAFNEMLERLETERRESGSRAVRAQEAERRRIGAELHDEVGQSMTGVLLLLERLAGELPADRADAVAGAQQAVRRSLDEVRRIAAELRPEPLEHLGLVSALKALAADFRSRSGLQLEWQFARDLPRLDTDAELVLYRVAQESLTNVARHADARSVRLELDRGRHSVVLRVVDDGRGLNGHEANGSGIRGMRERALIVGGALAVKSSPAGGVEVRLEVPASNGST
jgi:two-component system sensor histidine kinase UhpB